jgi:hypothetical protein
MEEIDECEEKRGSRLVDAMKSLYMRLRAEYVLTKRRVMTVASVRSGELFCFLVALVFQDCFFSLLNPININHYNTLSSFSLCVPRN